MSGGFVKRNTSIEGGIAYFAAVFMFLLLAVVFSVIFAVAGQDSPAAVPLRFAESVLLSVSFAAVAVISHLSLQSRPMYGFSRPRASALWVCPAVTVICLAGFQGLSFLVFRGLTALGFSQPPILDFSDPLDLSLSLVRVILVAPVCEEILMRGSVLSSCVCLTDRRRPKYRMLAVIATNGILFAALHMNPVQTVYQFLFGAVLAYVTVKYGSIVPAVAIHVLNNAAAALLSMPAADAFVSSAVDAALSTGWGIALSVAGSLVLAALAAAAVRFIVRRAAPGRLPESVSESGHNTGFRTVEDDNGALIAKFLYALSGAIAASVWVSVLVGGFMQ